MTTTTLAYIGAIGAPLSILVAVISALYARRSAIASESSARSANEHVEHEKTVHREANTAKVVRHDAFALRHEGDVAHLTLTFYNEGPAKAKNLKLTIGTRAEEWVSSPPVLVVSPFEYGRPSVALQKRFGSIGGWLIAGLVYEDGNGTHQKQYWIRTQGHWGTDWVRYIQNHEPTGEEE